MGPNEASLKAPKALFLSSVFLVVCRRLFKALCWSVCLSVGLSVGVIQFLIAYFALLRLAETHYCPCPTAGDWDSRVYSLVINEVLFQLSFMYHQKKSEYFPGSFEGNTNTLSLSHTRTIKTMSYKKDLRGTRKQVPEGTTRRPKYCRDWHKDCERKIVKERLWKKLWKKDCEKKIVK